MTKRAPIRDSIDEAIEAGDFWRYGEVRFRVPHIAPGAIAEFNRDPYLPNRTAGRIVEETA